MAKKSKVQGFFVLSHGKFSNRKRVQIWTQSTTRKKKTLLLRTKTISETAGKCRPDQSTQSFPPRG
eukprot:15355918-Ditylum_brightwellii.AAC.1